MNNEINNKLLQQYVKEFIEKANKVLVKHEKYEPKTKNAKEWLSKEEVHRMLQYTKDNLKHRVVIILMYSCALRCNEMLSLLVRDINLEEGTFIIRKSKMDDKPVAMILPKEYMTEICAIVKDKPLDASVVEMGYCGVYRLLQRIADRVGVQKKIGTHSLRRSRITHMIDDKVDIRRVQQLSRHKHISMITEFYDKMSPERLREVMDELKI